VGKFVTGPVGDVLKINKVINDENKYIGDCLSDAQFILSKRLLEYPDEKYGQVSITKQLIDWAESGSDLESLGLYMVNDHDSMGHVMKGNHGIFINCGKNINLTNISIRNVENYGSDDNRFADNFKEFEGEGEVIKETVIVRGSRNLGVKSRKNERGITNIISGYKEMKNNEVNPALGKLFIDDKYIAINNNIVNTPKEVGEQVTIKEKGERIWVIVSRKVENDIKDKEDNSKLSTGICITGSENISGNNIFCKDIISRYGNSHTILQKNINKNINI
jgi:hypothetical protein